MNKEMPPQEQEREMNQFRAEVEIKKLEEIKAGFPIHLFDVNTEELTELDREMWEKLKDHSISTHDIQRHRDSVWGKHVSKSCVNFGGYVANMATQVIDVKKED